MFAPRRRNNTAAAAEEEEEWSIVEEWDRTESIKKEPTKVRWQELRELLQFKFQQYATPKARSRNLRDGYQRYSNSFFPNLPPTARARPRPLEVCLVRRRR